MRPYPGVNARSRILFRQNLMRMSQVLRQHEVWADYNVFLFASSRTRIS